MVDQVVLRAASDRDAGAIAGVCNAHSIALHGAPDVAEREVAHWLGIPGLHRVVAERQGRVVGYADVQDEGAEHLRFEIDVRVDPEADGAVAGVLLATCEDWSRERAAPRAVARGFAASGDGDLRRALERAGYRVIRHSFHMAIDLAGHPPAPAWPEGIRVRTLRPGEEGVVYEAHMDAFTDHWDFHRTPYDEWARWLVESPSFDPSLWFLAEDGDQLAGISLCAPHFSGDPSIGWVSVLGVRPPWRRRGLGLALLHHSFAEFGRRGARTVKLGVDAENTTGAVRLYERAGMFVARRNDTYEKELG